MAKSLNAEMTVIEAEERKLAHPRKVHLARVREAGIASVEKAVKTLGVEEAERRLQAKS